MPLQKTSELKIQKSCIQCTYPQMCHCKIKGKVSERFLNKIVNLKMYIFRP